MDSPQVPEGSTAKKKSADAKAATSAPPARKRRRRGTGTADHKHNLSIPYYIDSVAMADLMDQYARDLDRKTLGVLVSDYFSPLVEGVVRVVCHNTTNLDKVMAMLRGIGGCTTRFLDIVHGNPDKMPAQDRGRLYFGQLTTVALEAVTGKSWKEVVVEPEQCVHGNVPGSED